MTERKNVGRPRRRPHFAAHVSLRTHRKTARLYGDKEAFGIWTGIGIAFISEYAAKRGDQIVVSYDTLADLTGCRSAPAYVFRKLDRVCAISTIRYRFVDPDGRGITPWLRGLSQLSDSSRTALGQLSETSVALRFPNFAVKQGITPEGEIEDEAPESREQRADTSHAPRGRRTSSDKLNVSEPLGQSEIEPPRLTVIEGEKQPITARAKITVQAIAAWPSLVAAAAQYGKRWGGTKGRPSNTRVRLLSARMRDGHSVEDLENAIHGAMLAWRGNGNETFDALRYLTPETLYRASNFEKYIEAFADRGGPLGSGSGEFADLVQKNRAKMKKSLDDDPPESGF